MAVPVTDRPDAAAPAGPPPAGPRTKGPWPVAGAVTVVLLALAHRYGYHRDELYFLLCGRDLDWGAGRHPSVASLYRALAETNEQDAQTEAEHRRSSPRPAPITGPGSDSELMERLQRQLLPGAGPAQSLSSTNL